MVASTKDIVLKGNDPALDFYVSHRITASERSELRPDELLPLNLDVQRVVTTMLSALPGARAFRAEIAAKLPSFDLSQFDNLGQYAGALASAQIAYLAASSPPETLPALAARAFSLRRLLKTDAIALAARGYIDPRRFDKLSGATGYMNVATDLGVLVEVFRDRWDVIASRSAIEPRELDEADFLFVTITQANARRRDQSAAVEAAADDRLRAFTLAVRAYDETRRAVTYLRWSHGDADAIVPSLWSGRKSSRKRAKREKGSEEPTPNMATHGGVGVGATPAR